MPTPAICELTGTVFTGQDTSLSAPEPFVGKYLTITPLSLTGSLLSTKSFTITSDSAGLFAVGLYQGGQYLIKGEVAGYDTPRGTVVTVPLVAAATLESIIYPVTGLTVQDEGVDLATLIGKFNFTGAGVTVTQTSAGIAQINITSGGGSVTSVGLTLPAIFTVAGSPVTTTGTLSATLANQTANTVFAGPSTGSPSGPAFRLLVAGDIPALSYEPTLGFTAVPNTRTVNGHALSANVTVTPTDLGLVIGTNVQAWDADLDAIAALAGTSGLLSKTGANTWALDTNVYATQAYANALVIGLLDDRGNFDASVNTFPASGGSGTAGVILKGDLWTISVAGTLGGHPVTAGDVVRALVDTPGQTDANWAIGENNFGYVALNQSLPSGQIYVGNGSGIGTAVTPSGDVTISNAGVAAIGAGKVVSSMLASSPTLTTPVLGVATATSINKITITQPATGATLTIPDGITLNAGAGGTLGSNAFNSTAFAPAASPTFTTAATFSFLTAGRILFAGTVGLLSDNANLLFNAGDGSTTTAALAVTGTALADNGSSNGSAASTLISITGTVGQSTSFNNNNSRGGNGATVSIISGVGGANSDSNTNSSLTHRGGLGGDISVIAGAGGAGTDGTGVVRGGTGGIANFKAGNGGSAAHATGGSGGLLNLYSGDGGASASGAGGNAGIADFSGGVGGIGTTISGNGGMADITGGAGGANSTSGGTAGNGGDARLNAGSPGTPTGGASAGTEGVVYVGNLAASAINIGKAGIVTTISGTLAAGSGPTTLTDSAGKILTAALNTVGVAQGGTGLATLTANNVMLGNGTSTPVFVAPGTSGNVLTSNGTTWTSAAAAGGGLTVGTTAITSGTTTRMLYDLAGVVQEAAGITTDGTNLTLTGASLTFTGNISAAGLYSTSGIRHKSVAATYLDTTSTGTVATAYSNVFGGSTLTATNATTITNYFTAYFNDPTASTNVTLTNKWAIGGDSMKIGTNLLVPAVASGVDGITITGAATANPAFVQIAATGSDSVIKIAIIPKGTNSGLAIGGTSSSDPMLVPVSIGGGTGLRAVNATFGAGGSFVGAGFYAPNDTTPTSLTDNAGLKVISSGNIQFSNGSSITGAVYDTMISRPAVSVLKLGDTGSAGIALQLPQKAATPANPGSSAEVNFYVKGNKLVFQYNDAGTVRYVTYDLTQSATAVWATGTSAP